MQVGIVGQRDNERAVALVDRLGQRLTAEGVDVVVDQTTAAALTAATDADDPDSLTGTPTEAMEGTDLVISVGGDGTFLYTARAAGSTPVMGVNLGEVGFLNAVPPGEAIDATLAAVGRLRDGRARPRELPRLVADGEGWELSPALNEVLVQGPRRGPAGGAAFEVRVDGDVYTRGAADGVLVATPTGSTAYNLSEGGPLVHPDVSGLVVTEMAGGEGMRPLVVAGDATVTIAVDEADAAYVVSDGRAREELAPPAAVTVRAAAEPARIAGPPRDFFAALSKLD